MDAQSRLSQLLGSTDAPPLVVEPSARNLRQFLAIAAVALAVSLAVFWLNRPANPTPLPIAAVSVAAQEVVVHVAGKVGNPGLVQLSAGARVADAIKAAGGAKRPSDLNHLNLAAHVVDGQLIVVGQNGGATGVACVDLNSATSAQLEALPGVGPVLAGRIAAAAPFSALDDLRTVSGIGPKLFAQIKPNVCG